MVSKPTVYRPVFNESAFQCNVPNGEIPKSQTDHPNRFSFGLNIH